MDQDTRKISASQLASVLAKADAKVAEALEKEHGGSEKASAPRPAAGEPAPASAPPAQVLAVIERPVGDTKVVNVTSPETPAHSSGRMPAAPPVPEPEAPALAKEASLEPEVAEPEAEAAPPPRYASLPVRLPLKSERLGVALVVFLFVACCVVLVVLDH